jgi:hypothetical protein
MNGDQLGVAAFCSLNQSARTPGGSAGEQAAGVVSPCVNPEVTDDASTDANADVAVNDVPPATLMSPTTPLTMRDAPYRTTLPKGGMMSQRSPPLMPTLMLQKMTPPLISGTNVNTDVTDDTKTSVNTKPMMTVPMSPMMSPPLMSQLMLTPMSQWMLPVPTSPPLLTRETPLARRRRRME